MKYVLIVPDGMADEPIAELGNKTPLEAARTPNMDALAKKGFSGMVQTIPQGMPPGSDIGNLSLLGYDPAQIFSGRAPLEAANMGVFLNDNEVAFRCNLVTLKNDTMNDTTKTDPITDILTERGKNYGLFMDQAATSQALKDTLRDGPRWGSLTNDMAEALEVIAMKMSRIVHGDPNHIDSWDDIAGYARLVADRLRGVVR